MQKSLQLAFFFFPSTAFGQTDNFSRQTIYDSLRRKRMTNIGITSFDTLKVFLKKNCALSCNFRRVWYMVLAWYIKLPENRIYVSYMMTKNSRVKTKNPSR